MPSSGPAGIAVDAAGNVYVADFCNQRVRKIAPGGAVTTVAGARAGNCRPAFRDGAAQTAQFGEITGIALGADGTLYVADPDNNAIRTLRRGK